MEKYLPIVSTTQQHQIHFDTLWEAACQELTRYAGKTWTDTAEHDPGVTLLQALTYGVSDLAYRHTLPLVDLLTEKDAEEIQRLFPEKFGPQWALTCTPVTADDYRRALLDLYCSDDSCFYFRNIQLIKEPDDQHYTYWYNATERQLQYHASRVEKQFCVMGGYQLFVEPDRAMANDANLNKAKEALTVFLKDHRNLCEQVRDLVYLTAQDLDVQLEVDLEDDCQDATRVMADIYTLVDDWISPKPQRATVDVLLEHGWTIEDIYHGPQLKHGWITELPPELNYGKQQNIDISGLARNLLAIPGVARIHKLAFPENGWVTTVDAKHYPRVWGETPFETLCQGQSVKLFKRGQQLKPSAEDVETEVKINAPKLIDNIHCGVQAGRRRNGAYRPASGRLPPCYGLQEPLHEQKKSLQRLHLQQFLLAFEQWLAGGCGQLSWLSQIMAFNRYQKRLTGDIWGYQWPFPEGSLPDQVHADYYDKLIRCIKNFNKDYDKELSIINYLLGYFGGRRPPRVLDLGISDESFLKIQQGYLEQFCELNYNRSNIRIDQVSALHKRIAARLGIDEKLFFKPEEIPLDQLPVYLIEYRSLLPLLPSEKFFQKQKPQSVEVVGVDLKLTFENDSLPGVGELIELRGGDGKINISWASVTKQEGNSIWVNIDRNSRLKDSINDIEANVHNMECSRCNAWVYDMDYPLKYAENQENLGKGQKRIQTELSATVLKSIKEGGGKKEDLIINVEIIGETEDKATLNLFQAKVDESTIDVANGCFVTKIESQPAMAGIEVSVAWPDNDKKYRWYIQRKKIEERFSFAIGIVLNRSQLLDPQRVTQPNDVAAWVEQIVQDEVPCHITSHIHWIDESAFEEFGKNYKKWQETQKIAQLEGQPYSPGDEAYSLLEKLSLGKSPDWVDGIGALHITTQEEWDSLTQNSIWQDKEEVRDKKVLYIPKLLS